MAELLENTWQGWLNFNRAGKLAGALLISLLFLWIYYKKVQQKKFLIYTTAVTLFCILPVTAALLQLYQTRFYDYKWIWSIVPVTAGTGYAATLFMTEFLQKESRKRRLGAAALLAAGLVFCGGMGTNPHEVCGRQGERQQAERLLANLQERMQGREICLWAPRSVAEYARACDGGIQLLYGRDMWDSDLTAYSYEKYPGGYYDLYRWMEAEAGEVTVPDIYCAETAVSEGVNCILIPEDRPEETIECFQELLGVQAEKLEGYYLLIR
ncbi:MAG: hypothetical protein NC123_06575 [Butyrivibrio sp.]|nr:hypothetical protein [Acetatifactor muris]MCM1559192.1 hypothetical protein [Butyrivibrio sp.]